MLIPSEVEEARSKGIRKLVLAGKSRAGPLGQLGFLEMSWYCRKSGLRQAPVTGDFCGFVPSNTFTTNTFTSLKKSASADFCL